MGTRSHLRTKTRLYLEEICGEQMGNDLVRARFGPYEVDLHTHELWKFGTRLKLVGQPFEILAVLLSKPGELVTREELRSRLWPADTFVDFNHGLNAAVNKLREALSDSAEEPRYIETLPRRGYRFIAAIDWLQPSPSVQPDVAPKVSPAPVQSPLLVHASPAPEPVAVPSATEPGEHRPWFRYRIGAVALFAFLIAVVFFLIHPYGHDSSPSKAVEHTRPLFSISDTSAPAFSLDGNSVAFYSEHSAGPEPGIYAAPVGSNQYVQLSNSKDDCCPVWSPDGRWVAFTRAHDHQYSIYLVPSDGGGEEKRKAEKTVTTPSGSFKLASAISVERKLDTDTVVPQRGEIDWSPDGKSIVFAGSSALYVAAVESPSVRRLTEPPPASEDWGPKFSPDGSRVMFVRTHQLGVPDELWTVPATGGDTSRVLSEPGKIASPPQWSYDGRSVIFASNRSGHPALWRAALDAPDSVVEIAEAGSPAWGPAVSRRGYRLAYERLLRSLSIWQMDLSEPHDKRPYLIVSSTSDTDQGPGPQFSPDGEKLAYMSDRSGTMEIWISRRDGSNPFQLTAVGGAGTPRWSPDSEAVAFDVYTPDGSKIATMNLHGGAPQILTPDRSHNVCPSWSRDGKWIYFASNRTDSWQVWKVPASGGTAVQVTYRGGHAALESLDGKFLYYAKNGQAEPEIWRVPTSGGEETLMPLVRPGTWASWQVVAGGILFVGPSLGHQAALSFYGVGADRTTTLAVLDRIPFWLGATSDGKTVAFDQPGREQDQAMLVDNFR
jgi:Tol biopolymer transport system component/DNA-binding winged helix-turn-helix (wHTH) protein